MSPMEHALRKLIESLDSDLVKMIETPEDGGPDGFPALAVTFEAMLDSSCDLAQEGLL